MPHPLEKFLLACKRHGAAPTRFALIISVAGQTVSLFERWGARPSSGAANDVLVVGTRVTDVFVPHRSPPPEMSARRRSDLRAGRTRSPCIENYKLARKFTCSTSRFGISQVDCSNGTPLGLHRIVEKIGGGWPVGVVFKSRKPIGYTWRGMPNAKITTRILWLEGLEPGFNRGGNVDSHARHIYIHGTADQTSVGKPASCGCVHLADADLIPLFDKLPAGTLVWIER